MDTELPEHSLPATGALADLPPEIRQQLAAAGDFVTLPEGSYLAIEGRQPEFLYVILTGSVAVRCHSHGETIDLAELGAGETVCEMSAINPHISKSTVRTNQETHVWQIKQEEFRAFMTGDPAVGLVIMTALAKELCRRIHQDSERTMHMVDEVHTASYEADI
ncbi:MAG: CRP-like cAMP-binding protein [Verrucomicrobiales bacterium]|jgi:CRP-like cAMP-binding protein